MKSFFKSINLPAINSRSLNWNSKLKSEQKWSRKRLFRIEALKFISDKSPKSAENISAHGIAIENRVNTAWNFCKVESQNDLRSSA